jgi:hypothetical protein
MPPLKTWGGFLQNGDADTMTWNQRMSKEEGDRPVMADGAIALPHLILFP